MQKENVIEQKKRKQNANVCAAIDVNIDSSGAMTR